MRPAFSTPSTPIHSRCTTPAPCVHPLRPLPSFRCNESCIHSPRNRCKKTPQIPAPKALISRLPQQNHGFPSISLYERRVNRGIPTANTTCCALYLTHPIRGGTFTTARGDVGTLEVPRQPRMQFRKTSARPTQVAARTVARPQLASALKPKILDFAPPSPPP